MKQKHAAQVKVLLGPTPNWAYRVISLARLIFNDFVEHQVIDSNPSLGVKRHKEAKRTRLLQWEEWWKIHAVAPRRLQLVMDGLYLTDQRIDDVLDIDERAALEQGIYFKQGKTGKELIVAWNDDLRRWWDECLAQHRRGNIVELSSNLQNRGKARPLFRTRHDNRAFSATEAKRQGLDPQKLLGHDDARTTKIYLPGREVEVVRGPTMRRVLGA